jgi:uncharacterized protein (TIGR03435 family)
MRQWIMVVLVCSLSHSQTPDKTLSFDAATIKPFVPQTGRGGRLFFFGGSRGGPGSSDPGRIQYPATTLKNLLTIAYHVKDFQVSGPGFLDTERFEIQATMPPETTKEQFQIMLQNLLAERFKVAIHRETKDLPMYTLTIAKNGPKLKESADSEEPKAEEPPMPPPGGRGPLKIGPDGFPVVPMNGGRGGMMFLMMPAGSRLIGQKVTMQELAESLSKVFTRPVTDGTGLKGKYDFTLTYSMEGLNPGMMVMAPPPPPPPGAGGRGPSETPEIEPPQNILAAIQSQLGLKLEPKKGPVDLIVVDHAEKTPTEN